MPDAPTESEIHESGLMSEFVPATEFNKFKYHIDIDGNTNSWPGLFQKLLTGSPVLKVASAGSYRQWYYSRLKPWVNFVPVLSDMSDLVAKIAWLHEHEKEAITIGIRGQELALSMHFNQEVNNSGLAIAAALDHSSVAPRMPVCLSQAVADS
jgi:hypothetical protein